MTTSGKEAPNGDRHSGYSTSHVSQRLVKSRLKMQAIRFLPYGGMRRIYRLIPSFLGSPNCPTSTFTTTSTTKSQTIMSQSSEFYSLKAERPNGKICDFAELQGKTVLIVNVASKWYVSYWPIPCLRLTIPLRSGFTPQYAGNTHLILPGHSY